MCGITGFIKRKHTSSAAELCAQVARMNDCLQHRGPDDKGTWVDAKLGIALAHRRLAIVDLSQSGHQPMASVSKRYQLVFNGEIYNYRDLRRQLDSEGRSQWRGDSDTEVLLACIDKWGVDTTLQRATGMFAFALWDFNRQELILARDRMGEKPLYYGDSKDGFVFGSELSAIKAYPGFHSRIDRTSLARYLQHGCVTGAHSIYEGINKLSPGTYVVYAVASQETTCISYWSLVETANRGINNPFLGTSHEAIDQLEKLIDESVKNQLVADVPVGAFLSGGIDSSTIVATMQKLSNRPVKTFTIGFDDRKYNEAHYAQQVANHLGTDHTELYVSSKMALDVIPLLPSIYSEPFADSSQIPTFIVSKLAAQHVKVSLSGDGGDELFSGYTRYSLVNKLWRYISRLPVAIRRLLAVVFRLSPASLIDVFSFAISPIAGRYGGAGRASHKIKQLASLFDSVSFQQLYSKLMSINDWSFDILLQRPNLESSYMKEVAFSGASQELPLVLDSVIYLPDDILTKVDRAAMSVSLETRVPLLDHHIVEFAWTLPDRFKCENELSKWPLSEVLFRQVPKPLFDRPKRGFGVPIGDWLRKELRPWAEDLLDKKYVDASGFFDSKAISHKWQEHLSGRRNWESQLWRVLMFQAWLRNQ